MEINELKKAKRDMEGEIYDAISHAIEEFRKRTGYSPHGIGVYMHDVTQIGERNHHYIISKIESEIDLW